MNITIKTFSAGKQVGQLETVVQPNMGDLNRPMKKAAISLIKQTQAAVAEVFCICDKCDKLQPILSVGKNVGQGQNGYYDWFVQHSCN